MLLFHAAMFLAFTLPMLFAMPHVGDAVTPYAIDDVIDYYFFSYASRASRRRFRCALMIFSLSPPPLDYFAARRY